VEESAIEAPAVMEVPPAVEAWAAVEESAAIEAPAVMEVPAAEEAWAAVEESAAIEALAVMEVPTVMEVAAATEAPAVAEASAAIEAPSVDLPGPAVVTRAIAHGATAHDHTSHDHPSHDELLALALAATDAPTLEVMALALTVDDPPRHDGPAATIESEGFTIELRALDLATANTPTVELRALDLAAAANAPTVEMPALDLSHAEIAALDLRPFDPVVEAAAAHARLVGVIELPETRTDLPRLSVLSDDAPTLEVQALPVEASASPRAKPADDEEFEFVYVPPS
jgi:hypothetical protein